MTFFMQKDSPAFIFTNNQSRRLEVSLRTPAFRTIKNAGVRASPQPTLLGDEGV